jgi:uncharacterized protein (UPF0212 family)
MPKLQVEINLATNDYLRWIDSQKNGWQYSDSDAEETAFECPECGAEVDVPFAVMKTASK